MKKLPVMALAAIFCLAFELPAPANVQVGGEVTFDWTYRSMTPGAAQRVAFVTTTNEFETMNFVTPLPGNRINVKYTSDDGALVGFVELWAGEGGFYYPDAMLWYAYIQWQITPTNRITFGLQTTNFARFHPNQWVGFPFVPMWGVGFGNVNHANTRRGIKGYWRISDMFGLVWGLWENRLEFPVRGAMFFVPPRGAPPPAWEFAEPENKLPRIDLALPIRFPWGRIEPSFTWSKFEYDQLPWEGDNSYNIWGVSIGTDVSFGMFSFGAEITWGENLGGGSYRGAELARPVFYVDSAGNRKVEDAEVISWFVDAGFKFGRNKINVMYGQTDYENAGNPNVPQPLDPWEHKLTPEFYGISWRIDVAKGFIIRPELVIYNLGDNTKYSALTFNRGKWWLLGVQFKLTF